MLAHSRTLKTMIPFFIIRASVSCTRIIGTVRWGYSSFCESIISCSVLVKGLAILLRCAPFLLFLLILLGLLGFLSLSLSSFSFGTSLLLCLKNPILLIDINGTDLSFLMLLLLPSLLFVVVEDTEIRGIDTSFLKLPLLLLVIGDAVDGVVGVVEDSEMRGLHTSFLKLPLLLLVIGDVVGVVEDTELRG